LERLAKVTHYAGFSKDYQPKAKAYSLKPGGE
jgi:hypothetical protein